MKQIGCHLCESKKIGPIFKKKDLHMFKCRNCGIVFLGDEISAESVRDLYSYYGYNELSNRLSSVTKCRYEKILNDLERYRKTNSIIDVGCGAGYFLKCATSRGWQADGSEISDGAVKLSEEKGQSVIKGDITVLNIEKGKYDVATLFEFIEHAADPCATVRKMSYILRPGGAIYITTPNYDSLTRKILRARWGTFHKEHLFYFTTKSLVSLLGRYGFKVVKIKTENLSLREILRVFKASDSLDEHKIYERQEYIRHLIERRGPLLAVKKMINFWLSISKMGETIYIYAEKSPQD